jgi:hypothetical protein
MEVGYYQNAEVFVELDWISVSFDAEIITFTITPENFSDYRADIYRVSVIFTSDPEITKNELFTVAIEDPCDNI